jgi:hypothetical protein
MIRGIIVGILCDAWMVASGCVPERGDCFRSHRIFQPFSPRALKTRRFFAKQAADCGPAEPTACNL